MATYLILNGAVLLAAVILAGVFVRRTLLSRPVVIAMLVLIALTAVFDNLIILSGIVAYDEALISGMKAYKAPIEDFAYCIAAVVLMPVLWKALERK